MFGLEQAQSDVQYIQLKKIKFKSFEEDRGAHIIIFSSSSYPKHPIRSLS